MARVLLLEDNADMLDMIATSLDMDGHEVLRGKTGKDGLDILMTAESIPDVIITDIAMPVVDGLEFIQRIRKIEDWKYIPCIIISGEPGDRSRALSHGADDFVLKPFRHTDLIEAINRCMAS